MSKTAKKPLYQDVDGFRIPLAFSPEAFRAALKYEPKKDEMLLTTYPKCGTTWATFIILLIYKKGKFESFLDFKIRSPYLERNGVDSAAKLPKPGIIKSHLPFNMVPYSKDAKYIYVSRNPNDTCVSFYYHTLGVSHYDYQDGKFDDYFELFVNGENDYADYFDHTLSWYERRNDSNVFFITYEEMKEDTRGAILKIAKFLGEEWHQMLINEPDIMEDVVKYSSIDEMKKSNHVRSFVCLPDEKLPSGILYMKEQMKKLNIKDRPFDFVRKGVVGDWKNHFNSEQTKRIDDKTREKLAGTELLAYWQSLGILD